MPASQATTERVVDARASVCPGPLVDLIAAVRASGMGDTVTVLARATAAADIRAWVAKTGHELVVDRACDGHDELVVRRMR